MLLNDKLNLSSLFTTWICSSESCTFYWHMTWAMPPLTLSDHLNIFQCLQYRHSVMELYQMCIVIFFNFSLALLFHCSWFVGSVSIDQRYQCICLCMIWDILVGMLWWTIFMYYNLYSINIEKNEYE